MDSLNIAATGMRTQQLSVDTIANNLANVNTTGFKRSRVNFTDLVSHGTAAAAATGDAAALPALDTPAVGGAGVAVTNVDHLFDGGEIRKTDNLYDLAIAGDGFLTVGLADGSRAYSRGGSFKLGTDGLLRTASGQPLQPTIAIPSDATSVTIDEDGRVMVTTPHTTDPLEVGQLDLVRFAHPAGLTSMGGNLFRASEASGEAIAGRAGEEGMGHVRQGYLETSNVKMVDEMVNLMIAQRAYAANVKVAQASDELMGLVNNLRK